MIEDYQSTDLGLSDPGEPEKNWITAVAVTFFGLQSVAQLLVSTYFLIRVWPQDNTITGDVHQIKFVLIAGAFGACVGILSDYRRYMFRAFKPKYLDVGRVFQAFWAYIVRAFLGAGAALAFYAALRAGLIALVDANIDKGLNPWGTAGISILVGMFGGLAIERLWSSAQALIGK